MRLVALLSIQALAAFSLLANDAFGAQKSERIVLFADRDDDDADGVPDADEAVVPAAPELVTLAISSGKPRTYAIHGNTVRILADGKPLPSNGALPAGRHFALEGLGAGESVLDVGGATLHVGVVEVRAVDGDGEWVDLARSHASLERTPPARLQESGVHDPDALRFVVIATRDDLPGTLTLFSLTAAGAPLDTLADLALADAACPEGLAAGLVCGSTLPIRAVTDDVDRNHPLVRGRSIKAELGGAIGVVSPRGDKGQMIRVAGPRHSPVGAIERFRAKLEVFLVRATPKGAPPMGGDDAGAIEVARAEIARANLLWGACGISFGPPRDAVVSVVDPPRPHLVALGCDEGLPASGGTIHLKVDARDIAVRIAPGMRPSAAARILAAAITASGFRTIVSDNAPIAAGAFGSADVLVRRAGGALALIEPPASGPVSSDATLTACIGRVDLDDGLAHFTDVDAIAGTVEERALIKAFDDGDPATIKVFLVPSFAGGGRIGESFIHADGGSVRNVIIEDRGGIRAARASDALAHELGHVLLDDPGHPDDFGIDTPTRLMDADAANPSAYGPRRLLVEECARAIRQAGPSATVPLLQRWPLGPLGKR